MLPTMSLQTLTVVRLISRIRSTAQIMAAASNGKPTALRIMDIMTRPACGIPAAPIEISTAPRNTVSCCMAVRSTPRTCDRKITATHSYKAVPSMLMVAPSGSTNPATRLGTPTPFSTRSMDNGSVAELLAVENAVISASETRFMVR